jgi:glycosyltransferase involved in cell wall biosynthesis
MPVNQNNLQLTATISYFLISSFSLSNNKNESNSIYEIFIRYAHDDRLPHLRRHTDSKKIYFMDDDLLDWKALLDVPLSYAFRLWCKATSKRKWLLSSCTKLWVSTPYLSNKYAAWNPRLLRPVASGPLLERSWVASSGTSLPSSLPTSDSFSTAANSRNSDLQSVRICYHGTWSHRDDMKWLAPVIAEVQQRCPNTVFEVIGGERVARIFKGIPRIVVLPTMAWPDYLKHTQTVHQDIGLAPLGDTLFNRGRGPIKFFDYARAGAVGVYSAGPAFSDFVSNGADGFVLENDPSLWVERIVELVNSPGLRQSMADTAWLKVLDNSPASPAIQEYLRDLNKALEQLA